MKVTLTCCSCEAAANPSGRNTKKKDQVGEKSTISAQVNSVHTLHITGSANTSIGENKRVGEMLFP